MFGDDSDDDEAQLDEAHWARVVKESRAFADRPDGARARLEQRLRQLGRREPKVPAGATRKRRARRAAAAALTRRYRGAELCAQDSVETPRDHARAAVAAAFAPVARIPRSRVGLLWAGELPRGILSQALSLLPTDCRVRASGVCCAWRDAAANPSLWREIWFSTSLPAWRHSFVLRDADVARLCARAGAALRVLRLDSDTCSNVTATGVVTALRDGGCSAVQRVVFPQLADPADDSLTMEQAQQLVAACPALEGCARAVRCGSQEDVAAVCALLPGPVSLAIDGDEPVAAWAALKVPARLTQLYIESCWVEEASLREALRPNTTLTTLWLSGCGINDVKAAALSGALQTNNTLTALNLAENQIGEAGAAALAEALSVNRTLSELCLGPSVIGDAGGAALGQALVANTALKTLGLRMCYLGDASAAALSQALRANTCVLSTLDLQSNDIGAAGAAALGEALHVNTRLTELQLCYNAIGDAGAASIGDALRVNATLKTLSINFNNIGELGVAALERGVRRNTTLEQFDVDDYNYRDIVPGTG